VSEGVGPLNKGFAEAKPRGDYMVVRFSWLPIIVSGTIISACLCGLPVLAAPTAGTINFTPPLANAKTIQVTETVWEAQNGSTPGPLRQTRTMAFRIQRPDKFWVGWKENDPTKPATYDVLFPMGQR